MTQDSNPAPEDDDPPENNKSKRPYEPGPEDDDPPPRLRVNSFFRSLWYMLARFFHRP